MPHLNRSLAPCEVQRPAEWIRESSAHGHNAVVTHWHASCSALQIASERPNGLRCGVYRHLCLLLRIAHVIEDRQSVSDGAAILVLGLNAFLEVGPSRR